MKILGTGLSGLVGSRVVELLKDGYEFEISDIDITDRHRIFERIDKSNTSIVLHLAAKTSVDGCEKDREGDQELLNRHSGLSRISQYVNGTDSGVAAAPQNDVYEEWNGKKTAWAVNVYGTKNIVEACQESNKKLIFISTDFVFDGSSPSTDGYKETDKPNPVNWYGKTKYEGEEIVKNSSVPWIIARIAYPYRAHFVREDFVRMLIKKLEKEEKLQMVINHIMTPTFVDDIAYGLDHLIKNKSTGIFHVVGSEFVSPYEAASKIAKIFGFKQNNITRTTRAEFFRNRAPRPFHLALKNDKIRRLGVKMRGLEEGLEEVKRQLDISLSS